MTSVLWHHYLRCDVTVALSHNLPRLSFLYSCGRRSGMESLGTSLKIYNLIDSHLIQDAKTYTNNQVPSVTHTKNKL